MVQQKDEVQIQIDELDTRLDRLRALFEQYFIGIEKIEPHVQKKDVERRFERLRKVQLRNTALRFRFNALVQKYTSYLTYWGRIARQIEEGTYRRDLSRLQRRGRPAARDDDEGQVFELDADAIESVDDFDEVDELADDDRPTLPPTAQHVAEAASASGRAPASGVPVEAKLAAASSPRSVEEFDLPFRSDAPPVSVPASPSPDPAPARPAKPVAPAGSPATRRAGLSVFGIASGARSAGAVPHVTQSPVPPAPSVHGRSAAMSAKPASTSPARAIPVPTPTAPLRDRDDVHALYERYSESRRLTGETEVSYDAVARQVRDTLPRLAERFPGADVSFDVTVKNGRTVLRPIVKKK